MGGWMHGCMYNQILTVVTGIVRRMDGWMDKQIYSHHHCRHWAPIATIIVGIAIIVVITTRVLSRFGSTTATSWHQREQQHVCYCDETPVRATAVIAGPQPTGGSLIGSDVHTLIRGSRQFMCGW